VGGGRQWDVLLHLFSAGSRARDGTAAPASIGARHADGVLSLLKPVVGSVIISKRRPSGQVFGSPRTLVSPALPLAAGACRRSARGLHFASAGANALLPSTTRKSFCCCGRDPRDCAPLLLGPLTSAPWVTGRNSCPKACGHSPISFSDLESILVPKTSPK